LASSIWIVDVNGSAPLRVTGDDFMDISPAWLDDDHLLFVSNREGLREVYVVEVGSTGPRREPRRVPGATDPHSISYSIEGRKLALSRANARQNIWSYPIGSGSVAIRDGNPVTSDNVVTEEHDISPDGEWIVYSSNLRGNLDIYKKRLDGGSPVPITESPLDEGGPRWSPDGTEITFVRSGGDSQYVMVVPAEGGIAHEVCSGLFPSWSPSGLEIAFQSDLFSPFEVWIVSRDSVGGAWSEPTQLNDSCSAADWAPDGSGVLCVPPSLANEMVLVSREGEELWRYDLEAVGLRRWYSFRLSRDASTIYVSAYHEDGSGGIWAIPLLGGEPSLAVQSAELWPPAWFSVGPDRLYITVEEHESDIWVMDVQVER
jgi:Tol biopolymer transport system component